MAKFTQQKAKGPLVGAYENLVSYIGNLIPGAKEGAKVGIDVMKDAQDQGAYRYSLFSKQYPKDLSNRGVTLQETPGKFLGAYAARVLTDIGTDSSRHIYWRYNHPMAIADKVVEKIAGEPYAQLGPTQKAAVGLAVGAPVSASLGIYDITNPGELFRQKGFAQSYAEQGSEDRRESAQPGLELAERMVLGRQGRPLKYETAKEDIPDLTKQRYGNYMRGFYQDKGITGLGLVKFTPENLQGYPEARIVGFPVGLQAVGALAGGATAMRQALKQPGMSTRAKAGITLAGSLAGGLTGNLMNQGIAMANRPKLPTVNEYQPEM